MPKKMSKSLQSLKLSAPGEHDARLLQALSARYADSHFDQHNISVDAFQSPVLLNALRFLGGIKLNRRLRTLDYRSHDIIERWFDRIDGCRIDGVMLVRDRVGWCHVVAAGCRE
jgi:hypothetical protein